MTPVLRLLTGVFVGASLSTGAVAGVDPACTPIMNASLAHAAAPASAQVSSTASFKLEIIAVAGKSYRRMDNDKWQPFGVDVAKAERDMVAQMKSGQIKLSKCKAGADAVIDGVATRTISYTVEMPGAPAESATLHIGKADGLPYAQISGKVNTRYRYRGVTVPKL